MDEFRSFAGRLRMAAAALTVLAALAMVVEARAQAPLTGLTPSNTGGIIPTNNTVSCTTAGTLALQALRRGGGKSAGQQPDLLISKPCTASLSGTYYYGNVNIVAGGSLTFQEPSGNGTQINFWAKNIIVENGGKLIAGTAKAPYGARGGVLNIYLYGPNQSGTSDPVTKPGQGALCNGQLVTGKSGPCGIPWSLWNDNGTTLQTMPGTGSVQDYFYQYGPNYGDNLCSDGKTQWSSTTGCGTGTAQVGYFGYKVLAVSYGGTLQLFGYKGTPLPKPVQKHPLINVLPGAGQSSGNQNPLAALLHPSAPSQSQNEAASEASSVAATPQPNPATIDADPRNTGYSWMRLAANLVKEGAGKKGAPNTLTLSKSTGDRWWSANDNKNTPDQIVVTTTDYLPGHSEKYTISSVSGTTLSFMDAVNYPHNGTKYPVESRLDGNAQRFLDAGMDPDLIKNGAETRAAVALLTRSIRILSAGDTAGQTFEQATTAASKSSPSCTYGAVIASCYYYFGANTIFRQGFKQVQMQGVELVNTGQGGKLGHYAFHFHMARKVPTDTFIKDSSCNESMTRCVVLHSTVGVLLQRNVGWKSIGHMYFLENGTETDNKFYSNIGIFARAATNNAVPSNPNLPNPNPRMVPGIFSAGPGYSNGNLFLPPQGAIYAATPDPFPYSTDIQHPTVFWITNGWNDFIGNMAAGAGACGAAYWLVPTQNNDMADVPTSSNTWWGGMKWPGPSSTTSALTTSYSQLQNTPTTAGSTPLRTFSSNYASSTMTAFQTVAVTSPCTGADFPGESPASVSTGLFPGIQGFAPAPPWPTNGMLSTGSTYYPSVSGGGRTATLCPTTGGDCNSLTGTPPNGSPAIAPCSNGAGEVNCTVTVIDHFTSSFHWAQTNFSALWFRPQWTLVANAVLTDVQTGGLSFITSGDYSRSSAIEGIWSVLRTSLLAGTTQSGNGYSSNGGPFLNGSAQSLNCDNSTPGVPPSGTACTSISEGVSLPLANFGTGQRLFSIYDGPAYQESNIYLDVTTTPCNSCMYAYTPGVRKQTVGGTSSCYLPNAAIGWKQPNGFFYPPAFHSSNLFFGTVDIEHYVIDALFRPGTYNQNNAELQADYCPIAGGVYPTAMFTGFTDIDRQTELSDDDGTLTGLTNNAATPTGTVSVNPADYFNAPVQTNECLSNVGVTGDLACPSTTATPTPTTAITSPYEYVTTAIYPQCAVSGTTDPACANGAFQNWATDCTNPSCYGVPLYRQFLTGTGTSSANATGEMAYWFSDGCSAGTTSTSCRWPFVRMGGQATNQRSSMTTNNNVYYLDTTVSQAQQGGEGFSNLNVFAAGQTYYVYFLYTKPDTQQTYQIYVGPGFSTSTDLRGVNLALTTLPIISTDVSLMSPGQLPAGWNATYDSTTNILTVTTNFAFPGTNGVQTIPANGLCLPKNFCAVSTTNSNECGCALSKTDPLYGQCQQACSVWSMKALDFPPNGAYGFAFTLPSGFTTAPYTAGALSPANRPGPVPFPTTSTNSAGPDWLTQFMNTSIAPDSTSGSQCYYKTLPGSTTCPVTWPNPALP